MHSLVYCLRAPFRPHGQVLSDEHEDGTPPSATPTDREQIRIYSGCRPSMDTLLILAQTTLPKDHPSTLHFAHEVNSSKSSLLRSRDCNDSGMRIEDIIASPGFIGRVKMLRVWENPIAKRIKRWRVDQRDDSSACEDTRKPANVEDASVLSKGSETDEQEVPDPFSDAESIHQASDCSVISFIDKQLHPQMENLSIEDNRNSQSSEEKAEEWMSIICDAMAHSSSETVTETVKLPEDRTHPSDSEDALDSNDHCNGPRLPELRISYQLRPVSQLSGSVDSASLSTIRAFNSSDADHSRSFAFANLFGVMTDETANYEFLSELSETDPPDASWCDLAASPTSSIYSKSLAQQDIPSDDAVETIDENGKVTLPSLTKSIDNTYHSTGVDDVDSPMSILVRLNTRTGAAVEEQASEHTEVEQAKINTASSISPHYSKKVKHATKFRKSSLLRQIFSTKVKRCARSVSSPILRSQGILGSSLDGLVDPNPTFAGRSATRDGSAPNPDGTHIKHSVSPDSDLFQPSLRIARSIQPDQSQPTSEPRLHTGSLASLTERNDHVSKQQRESLRPSPARRRGTSLRCDASSLMEEAIAANEEEKALFRVVPPRSLRAGSEPLPNTTSTFKAAQDLSMSRGPTSPRLKSAAHGKSAISEVREGQIQSKKIGTRLHSWCQFPSYTRRVRNTSAGDTDGVLTQDFAVRTEKSGTSRGHEDDAGLNAVKEMRGPFQGRSKTFGDLLRYYSNIFATGRGGSRRSSVTTGGWLEHPELEMIPPVSACEPPAGDPHHHRISLELQELEERAHQELLKIEQQAARKVHQHFHHHAEGKLFQGGDPFMDDKEPRSRDRTPTLVIDPREDAPRELSSEGCVWGLDEGLDEGKMQEVGIREDISPASSDARLKLDGATDVFPSVASWQRNLGRKIQMSTVSQQPRLSPGFKGSVRRFPSVTVVDDMQGHSRSVSLFSVASRRSGIVRASTHDLLQLLEKKEREERAKLLGVVGGE